MRRAIGILGVLALLLGLGAPSEAAAQVRVSISLPAIHFDVAPALVIVSPGIQVVPDYGHEVFFSGGFYWHLHDGHWYRAGSLRHPKWKKWKKHDVPPGLRKLPPGKYKHHKAMKKAAKHRKKHHEKAVKAHKKSHKKPAKKGHAPGHGKGKGKKHK